MTCRYLVEMREARNVDEIERKFLRMLGDQTGHDLARYGDLDQIAESLGISQARGQVTAESLARAGYVEIPREQSISGDLMIGLTPRGLVELEDMDDEQPAALSSEVLLSEAEVGALHEFVTLYAAARDDYDDLGLDDDSLLEGDIAIHQIEDEIKSPRAKRGVIRAVLAGFLTIGLGTAGSAGWDGIRLAATELLRNLG